MIPPAIFKATGLWDAKHNRKRGAFFEFLSTRGDFVTKGNTVSNLEMT
jgi:hypothetical protein